MSSDRRYTPVPPQVDLPAMEREVLALWEDAKTFDTSLRQTEGGPTVDVLRGPADGERPARRAPRGGPGLQGRLPAVQDHAGLPRGPEGRLGLPRPPRRDRGGEGARLQRQGRHRGLRRRRVQREVPRVGAAARRRVRGDDPAARLLGRRRRPVPDDGPGVRAERLVVAQAGLRQGPARRGLPGRAVLPALRHRSVRPRAGAGLRDRRRPVGLRPLPAHQRPVRRHGRAAGLDHHAVDPRLQHRRRGPPGRHLRHRDERRGDPRGGRAAGRAGAGRGLDGAGPLHRRRDGALVLRAPAGPARLAGGRGRPLRAARRLRHHRGRHRARPPVPRLRRRGPGRHPGVRPAGGAAGAARRALRGVGATGRRRVLQARRQGAGEAPRGDREDVPAPGLRARLPALLALPHRAALLRAALLVRPHDAGQGRSARRERAHRLVPREHQVGPLRRLAAQQHRLGAVPQPVLGHPAADLALHRRRLAPGLRRVAGRARRAGRAGPVDPRPAPAVRRRRDAALHPCADDGAATRCAGSPR